MNPQDLVYRSNPESTPNTVVNAYIKNEYATDPINVSGTINSGATTISLSATLPASNTFQYLRMVVTDGNGVEAVGAFDVNNIAGGIGFSSSVLDKNTDWVLQLFWSQDGSSFDKPKFGSASLVLQGTKGSATFNFSTQQAVGTLQVWAELWKAGVITVANAIVADNGTAAFGNVTANSDAYAIVTFKNTGTSPLRITAIPSDVVGDGSISTAFGDQPSLPLIIAAGETSAAYVKVLVDTTVGAGAITPIALTIINNTSNTSYVVNFSATIV